MRASSSKWYLGERSGCAELCRRVPMQARQNAGLGCNRVSVTKRRDEVPEFVSQLWHMGLIDMMAPRGEFV